MGSNCVAAVALLASGLFFSAAAAGQQEPTFKVDVKLVRLLATVSDDYGRPVGGLNKEDFTVFENGVKQEIAIFERHTEQPLSVAVLLDVSGSTGSSMSYQTEAVGRFVKALFGEGNPEDRAALYTFNWQVSREVPYSRSPARFTQAMRRLKGEAGTSLYDAIFLAAEDIEDRQGRHVLVVVTDGGDTVSHTSFQKALEAVHAADAVVYPILTVPIANEAGRNVGGENALTTIAETTGGKMFVPGMNGIDDAFAQILRDLRTQYLLGYYPRNVPVSREAFHRISIRTERPSLRVVSRTGYYGDFEATSRSPRD